jgi:hypothetical protein
VVRAHDARLRRFPALAVLGDLVMSAWMLAGVGLLAIVAWPAANQGVVGSSGPGFYLSGAIVSLRVAAVYVPALRRTLLRHARN